MRLFVTGLTLLVALSLTAPAGNAFGPNDPLYTGATVEFRDWPGDGIKSDATLQNPVAPYVDGGSRGLEVRAWINGSQDVTVGTFRSGRKINFTYAPATDVGQQIPLNAPAGTLSDNTFVNIRNIAGMEVFTTKITSASFNTAIGSFRWLTPAAGATNHQSYGSQAVVVERTSTTTWEVHTPNPAEVYAGYPAGDLSVLLKEAKGKLTPVALYHLPFGLTVTCDACPVP